MATVDDHLERWFQVLRGELPGGLDALLHEDCAFASPIVFTPQRGRELTKAYLGAAFQNLGGDHEAPLADEGDGAGGSTPTPARSPDGDAGWDGRFRYVKRVAAGDHAVLEFETTLPDGTYCNGVDILTFDAEGLVTELKVMVRPLRAIEAVHAQMRATLEQMAALADGDRG